MGAIAGFQLHTVSITTEDKGMAKGNPARCDSVKENKHSHPPEALVWMQQVYFFVATLHFQVRGVYSKL